MTGGNFLSDYSKKLIIDAPSSIILFFVLCVLVKLFILCIILFYIFLRFVRLREKARKFNEMPPPRRVPVAMPSQPPYRELQPVKGVPSVAAEVLEKRLDFLLGEKAIQQQLQAELIPGFTPYQVFFVF